MKKLVFFLLLFLMKISYGQTNYYNVGIDSLYNEAKIKMIQDSASKDLPTGYFLRTIIFHKMEKKDSIVNYVRFVVEKDNGLVRNHREFDFIQDSVFLFLNKKLPEFMMKDITGNSFSSSGFVGKPTMINFWGIYCSPCIAELPQLNRMKEKYGNKVNFIAVTEMECDSSFIYKFLEKHVFNYAILLDINNYKKNILKIKSIPLNLFIDKNGIIRDIQAGLPYEKDQETGKMVIKNSLKFEKIIDRLLEN
jgi:cytochrome c biogenesis protein CcmG, thiol:disulfide interchange protein DsbE